MATNKTPQEFYVEYVGKRFNQGKGWNDSYFGYQCVAGFKAFCEWIGIPVILTPNNYANGYWTCKNSNGTLNSSTKSWQEKYFDKITDWKQFQNGDWVMWAKGSKSHPSSHIAMWYLGKEFGQNQGGNASFCLKSTDFTDACGALRPKQWVKEVIMAKILFIGNSYTYKPNDKENLPQAFKAICKSNGINVDVTMIAEGGWTFENHWNNSATVTAIKSKKYKYVILQGQSDEVGCRNGKLSDKAKTYGKKLGDLAKQYGCKVWFMSQADYYFRTSGNSKVYYNMKYQDSVDANYRIIANSCNAWVCCGGKKVKATANGNYASYFASDGYHPTAKAQKVIAQALWESLKSELKPTPAPAKITYVHATGVASYFDKAKAGTYEVVAKDGLHIRNDGVQSAKSLAVLPYKTKFTTYGYYDKDSQGRIWLYGVAKVGNTEYTGFSCAKSYLKKV